MNKSIKIIINYIFGPLLFVVLSYSLYRQIIKQPDLPQRWLQIKEGWQTPLFWFAFLLMFVNWGIESVKWKLLISPLQRISLFTSIKAVLSGCSITMLTPNRVGEYAGRVMFIEEGKRIEAAAITVIGSISQLAVTVFFGALGMLIVYLNPSIAAKFETTYSITAKLLLIIGLVLSLGLVLFYLNVNLFLQLLTKVKILKKIGNYLPDMREFGHKRLLIILFLSFLRYIIFILQYILLLWSMKVEIQFLQCIWLISIFYFLMAIIPSIGFTELPVRAAASVLVLGLLSSNVAGINAASFSIWLINLVFPATIGGIINFRTKIIKTS